ncbi:hypothetical protein HanXRQr2_Chr03g0093021 [Helianthus annuus]|uniref:Uncharacterized protein n=1 Tax=Helianthus annuus TaxID=4232 RepID=A0A9K3NVH2_HELAN|nr:hypothetical protein HanXRQr2_Chr03g0093021 [Helianthus annuus]KAJ0959046.1 hypothetical protein HanPSC8_Chr00c881g0809741 [Helianthus annuus]
MLIQSYIIVKDQIGVQICKYLYIYIAKNRRQDCIGNIHMTLITFQIWNTNKYYIYIGGYLLL